jgi:hypothetical protein
MKNLIKTFLTVGATLTLMLVGTVPAFAYAAPNSDIQRIFDDTNAARASNGLPALVLNEQMTSVAQNWSQQQASAGSMSHNPNYSTQIPGGWSGAAENVAYGYAVGDVTNGWMNSPGHKANILGDYNSIGIGVQNGYYTQVFAKYANVSQPAPEQPTPTQPAPEQPAPEQPAPETPIKNPQPVTTQPTPVENAAPTAPVTPEPEITTTETPVDTLVKTDELARDKTTATEDTDGTMSTMDEENPEEVKAGPNPVLIGLVIGSSVLLAVAVFFLVRILRKK